MRIEPSLYFNFNQMLVISVLVHCLFMTFVLFMPKTQLIQEKIQPTFFVELVDLSALPGIEPNPKTGETQKETAPVVPKKKTEATVKVPPSLLDHLPVQELTKSEADSQQTGNLVEKLDQVAKLETNIPTPSKKTKTPPLFEENIHDLESLKTAPKITVPHKKTAPRNMESTLKAFETLQMEESVEPAGEISVPKVETHDLTLKEMEFAMLAQQEIEHKDPGKTPIAPAMMKALMELEELKKKKQASPEMTQKIETTVETQVIQNQAEAKKVLEKIATLQKGDMVISFDLDQGTEVQALDFKSEIWNVEAPDVNKQIQGKMGTLSASKQTYVFKGTAGSSQGNANPLSNYVGLIYQRVMNHWRNPLGAGQSKVVVFFYVYKNGNISQPSVFQSSGDDQLDRLALLAVKESEPFPSIPPELNKSNLPIKLNFNYVYKQ